MSRIRRNSIADLAAVRAALDAERIPIHMALDHRVSQGLYISDPDGNLIELYVDASEQIWREDPSLASGSELGAPPGLESGNVQAGDGAGNDQPLDLRPIQPVTLSCRDERRDGVARRVLEGQRAVGFDVMDLAPPA